MEELRERVRCLDRQLAAHPPQGEGAQARGGTTEQSTEQLGDTNAAFLGRQNEELRKRLEESERKCAQLRAQLLAELRAELEPQAAPGSQRSTPLLAQPTAQVSADGAPQL
ncbi:unnamed protein product [Amoebophrya sp. A25]|nr:unnamed protein product [Amoebophrya sp. A25]|eukprot:GSA25T00027035001.1